MSPGELQKGRKFVIPSMARFVVKKRPATKARQGINPFTKEPCVFKAKPASKTVKVSFNHLAALINYIKYC